MLKRSFGAFILIFSVLAAAGCSESLQQQAEAGDPEAQYKLAMLYATGGKDGEAVIAVDKALELKWLKAAAAQGHAAAKAKLQKLADAAELDAILKQKAADAARIAEEKRLAAEKEKGSVKKEVSKPGDVLAACMSARDAHAQANEKDKIKVPTNAEMQNVTLQDTTASWSLNGAHSDMFGNRYYWSCDKNKGSQSVSFSIKDKPTLWQK